MILCHLSWNFYKDNFAKSAQIKHACSKIFKCPQTQCVGFFYCQSCKNWCCSYFYYSLTDCDTVIAILVLCFSRVCKSQESRASGVTPVDWKDKELLLLVLLISVRLYKIHHTRHQPHVPKVHSRSTTRLQRLLKDRPKSSFWNNFYPLGWILLPPHWVTIWDMCWHVAADERQSRVQEE